MKNCPRKGVFWLLVYLVGGVTTQDYSSWTTSCVTNRTVREGERAVVTCTFTANPRDVGSYVYVLLNRPDGDTRDTREIVLDCPGSIYPCETPESYWFDNQLGKTVSLVIPVVSSQHEGIYICEDSRTQESNRHGCWLKIADTSTDRDGSLANNDAMLHHHEPLANTEDAKAAQVPGTEAGEGPAADDALPMTTIIIVAIMVIVCFFFATMIVIIHCIFRQKRWRRKKDIDPNVPETGCLISSQTIENIQTKLGEMGDDITSTKPPQQESPLGPPQRNLNDSCLNRQFRNSEEGTSVRPVSIESVKNMSVINDFEPACEPLWSAEDVSQIQISEHDEVKTLQLVTVRAPITSSHQSAMPPIVIAIYPNQHNSPGPTELKVSKLHVDQGKNTTGHCLPVLSMPHQGQEEDIAALKHSDEKCLPLRDLQRAEDPALCTESERNRKELHCDEKSVTERPVSDNGFLQSAWTRVRSAAGYGTQVERGGEKM